ncbi:DUF1857-domain-containing protein [Myriangium duriaei CBS 260.36]|uniref:DUF1857-domain-containing protein n=1 Tax=Myriangium duriaei CBS 260.36 TaxID=1168546 RepID=A0A9P4J6I8_9PEZI|nr:DUF1857-domain-containing protein [Myriangium duriaei CBS 260.36]
MPNTTNLAYTAPINPPSAPSTLTRPQIWAGLQRKIRHAEEFVTAISTCTVLSDTSDLLNGTVEREVQFAPQAGGAKARETVVSVNGLKVDFHQADGGLVSNIISDSGEEGDRGLYMTYTFQFVSKEEQGTEGWEKERKRMLGMARGAVEGSIDTIRRLVKEGKL